MHQKQRLAYILSGKKWQDSILNTVQLRKQLAFCLKVTVLEQMLI